MCDFRGPPKKVKLDTGEVKEVTYRGNVSVEVLSHPNEWADYDTGVYYLCGSGSSYAYFDGEFWDVWGRKYELLDFGLQQGFLLRDVKELEF